MRRNIVDRERTYRERLVKGAVGVPEYEIRVRGHLDERWQDSFSGMAFVHHVDEDDTPLTVIRGPVADEAALHGLLARIRDLGIPLLAVRRNPGGPGAGTND